jgi:hypothetical protein
MTEEPKTEYFSRHDYIEMKAAKDRFQELYNEAVEAKTGLEEACRKLTSEVTFQKAEVREGEATLRDVKKISELVFSLIKAKEKPNSLTVKYRGQEIYEFRLEKQEVNNT